MPLDEDALATSGSAEWWLFRLGRQLDAERPQLDLLDAYDRGEHPLPRGHERAREAYRRFQRMSRSNFVGLVTDAVLDRLQVAGFRMGGQGEHEADETAQRVWQGNQLDADAGLVMRDALVMRRSYVCVGPDDDGGVLLTGEDPRQVIHAVDPRNRRRVRAALKVWRDDLDGLDHAVVYLPETVHYFVSPKGPDDSTRWQPGRWDVDDAEVEGGVIENPTAPLVPVVPFVNRPDKDRGGFGEAEDVTDIQDRINQTALDRLTTGAAQAFRQRWAKGVALEDEQGRALQPFDPGADLLWAVDAPDAQFGDFDAADLGQFIDAVKHDTEQLASITRTPPYYLLGAMANLSGDALTAAESGLVSKVKKRMAQFGESWEQAMRLAFMLLGEEAAVDAETIWTEPERRNEAAAADAAVKKQSVGVPWRQIMEDLRYSPQQIARMDAERTSDAFLAALTQPAQPDESASAPVPEQLPAG